MGIKRKKPKPQTQELRGWTATTPTRTHVFEAESAEEAAAKFMEKFGYYPDINQLIPILTKE